MALLSPCVRRKSCLGSGTSVWKAAPISATYSSRSSSDYLRKEREFLQREEADAFYVLNQSMNQLSDHMKDIRERAKLVPSTESRLAAADRFTYIHPEEFDIAKMTIASADSLLAHYDHIRAHLKDLTNEPYPEWNPDEPDQQEIEMRRIQTNDEYRESLDVQTKERKSALDSDTHMLRKTVDLMSQVLDEASRNGINAAVNLMESMHGKRMGSPRTVPKPGQMSTKRSIAETEEEYQLRRAVDYEKEIEME